MVGALRYDRAVGEDGAMDAVSGDGQASRLKSQQLKDRGFEV